MLKNPHHNGVEKRMNRIIEEKVKCMLFDVELPNTFWYEVIKTIVDLFNLSPSPPLYCDVHIPKDKRSKLDDKDKECIFLGYSHDKFGYRLWDPICRKVITSKCVVFLEDQLVSVDRASKPQSSIEVYFNLE